MWVRKFVQPMKYDTMITKKQSYWILGFIFFILFFNLSGNRPFATPDEGRYVEIPREMVVTGDYITPKLNAMTYFEKPPLMYWVQSIMIHTFGMDEGVMRISIALCAFLGVLALFLFMCKQTNRTLAIYSALILTFSPLYYFLGRLIILDMPLSMFITLSYICFYQGVTTENKLHKRLYYYGLSASLGFGILTKGIVILVLTGPVFILWLILTGGMRQLWPLYLPTNALLFLSIVVPWHYLAHKANPDFLHKYFYVEHVLRYTTSIHQRYKPFWFFLPFMLAGMLPWTLIAIRGIQQGLKQFHKLTVYLILWCSWILIFYSLGNSKLIPYILPAMVPLAGLIALGIPHIMQLGQKDWTIHTGMMLLTSLSMIVLLSPYFINLNIAPEAMCWIKFITIIFCILSTLYHKMPTWRIICLSLSSAVMIMTTHVISPYIQKTSVQPLANIINDHKKAQDVIVSMGSYFQDLPVYTQTAPIVCVDAISELEYGMDVGAPKTLEWMLTKAEFIQKFGPGSGRSFWAIAKQNAFKEFSKQVPHWQLNIKGKNKELILFYHNGS